MMNKNPENSKPKYKHLGMGILFLVFAAIDALREGDFHLHHGNPVSNKVWVFSFFIGIYFVICYFWPSKKNTENEINQKSENGE